MHSSPSVFSRLIRWFLVLWFCATLPLVILLTVNGYARFVCVEMTNHYVAKVMKPETVLIGDSLTGDRNWGWALSGNPFASRNLSCAGYTVNQVRSLGSKALAYHPTWVLILAGTNDVLDPYYEQDRSLAEYKLLLEGLKTGGTKPVVTLVPQMADGGYTAKIEALNAALRQLCTEEAVPVVDLNPVLAPEGKLLPQFTTDGVHFTATAYQIWGEKLREVIRKK